MFSLGHLHFLQCALRSQSSNVAFSILVVHASFMFIYYKSGFTVQCLILCTYCTIVFNATCVEERVEWACIEVWVYQHTIFTSAHCHGWVMHTIFGVQYTLFCGARCTQKHWVCCAHHLKCAKWHYYSTPYLVCYAHLFYGVLITLQTHCSGRALWLH